MSLSDWKDRQFFSSARYRVRCKRIGKVKVKRRLARIRKSGRSCYPVPMSWGCWMQTELLIRRQIKARARAASMKEG